MENLLLDTPPIDPVTFWTKLDMIILWAYSGGVVFSAYLLSLLGVKAWAGSKFRWIVVLFAALLAVIFWAFNFEPGATGAQYFVSWAVSVCLYDFIISKWLPADIVRTDQKGKETRKEIKAKIV